jgi:hypothetical protein
MTNVINVWNEVRFTADGISITLFSESQEGGAVVEDELWYTYEEMQELSPSRPFSLNLTDETQSAIATSSASQGLQQEMSDYIEEYSQQLENEQVGNLPKVGDVMIDKNAPPWSNDERVEVTNITDTKAENYIITERFGQMDDETVASANPYYPTNDTVIEAKYLGKDGRPTGDSYAFPESRLVEE